MNAQELASALGGRVTGLAQAVIHRAVHPAEASRDGDIAVAVTPDTIRLLPQSRAAMALVPDGIDVPHAHLTTLVHVRRSRATLPGITEVFRYHHQVSAGVHPSAVVAPDAVIGAGAWVGPLVVIGAGAVVGARSVILSQATLGAGARLGEDCLVHPGVRIGWGCRVGDRAVLHNNASIGADGFGFVPTRPGALESARGGNGPRPAEAARGMSATRC